jgi:hypothetical protein
MAKDPDVEQIHDGEERQEGEGENGNETVLDEEEQSAR